MRENRKKVAKKLTEWRKKPVKTKKQERKEARAMQQMRRQMREGQQNLHTWSDNLLEEHFERERIIREVEQEETG